MDTQFRELFASLYGVLDLLYSVDRLILYVHKTAVSSYGISIE